jgi:hypothetical protein
VGVPESQRQLYAPFLRAVNGGSRQAQGVLQTLASFNPLYLLGEGLGGRDLYNCRVSPIRRILDLATVLLPFVKVPKINLLPERFRNLVPVSRWGREGLQPGDWIMRGPKNRWNYLRSFKWQPGMGNQYTTFKDGEEFYVPASSIKWPKGWGIDGWWKGLFGQRIYKP